MNARHRIAIVDDDHSVRKAFQRFLRAADLDAEAYESGRKFLDTLPDDMPDCLVLDLQMPDMNGLEVQRRLIERGIQVPVIIVTGHDESRLLDQCLAAGASACLHKPLNDTVLLEAIGRAIAQGARRKR